jgi:hypothetical protein
MSVFPLSVPAALTLGVIASPNTGSDEHLVDEACLAVEACPKFGCMSSRESTPDRRTTATLALTVRFDFDSTRTLKIRGRTQLRGARRAFVLHKRDCGC